VRNQSLYRQWQILHLINQHRLSGISKGELAEHFRVSKKTIYRDIVNLGTCGFPIYGDQDMDRDNQVFYYFTPGYKLPDYTLNYEDILNLSLASKLWSESGLVTADSISSILHKIESKLDRSILKFYRDVQRALISDSTGVLMNSDTLGDKLSLILKAILNYKTISFDYYSVQSQRHSHKEVSPLAVKYFNHNFYLAGYYEKIDQVIVFAINRMDEIKVSDKPQHEVSFDSGTYFDSGFGIYVGEVFDVKLQFFSPTSDYIAERLWHPRQKITRLEDKSIILEMPANSLSEMKKFVLSYGARVKVMKPEKLRDLVLDEIKLVEEVYQ